MAPQSLFPDEMGHEERLKFVRDNFQPVHPIPDDELSKLDRKLTELHNGYVAAKEKMQRALEEDQEWPTVYMMPDDGIEAHMIGEYVAVCWRLRETKTVTGTKNNQQIHITYERSGEPYIDFLVIREHQGEPYRDEDSPVEGGISPHEALVIADELQKAIAHLEQQ